MFNPTSVQEMQLKTTEMSQPLRWVKCVIQTMTSIGEDVGKYNHRLFVLSEIWCNHLENNWAKPSKIQSMPMVRFYIPLSRNPHACKEMCTRVLTAALSEKWEVT